MDKALQASEDMDKVCVMWGMADPILPYFKKMNRYWSTRASAEPEAMWSMMRFMVSAWRQGWMEAC